jgi:hypothetical protein
MNKARNSLILFSVLFAYGLFLPIYQVGSLTNIFLQDKITWADGRSPLVFHLIGTIYNNQTVFFNNLPPNVDFWYLNDSYMLSETEFVYFMYMPSYAIGQPFGEIVSYKLMILSNLVYFALTAVLLFMIQKHFGLEENYAFFSSLLFGLGTGFVTYTRYFFSSITLMFLLSLGVYLFLVRKKLPYLYLVPMFFLILGIPSYIVIFLPFLFLLDKKEMKSHAVRMIFVFMVVVLYSVYFQSVVGHSDSDSDSRWNYDFFMDLTDSYGGYSLDRVLQFPDGYRKSAEIYLTGGDTPGLFVASHSFFEAMFSEKGFVYNSPFLVFSVLGALIFFKRSEKKFWFMLFMFLVGMLPSFAPGGWAGGYTPRYVRFYFPAIFPLCFFSLFFVQENKDKRVLAIFLFLVGISFLNNASMAMRPDWNCELPYECVSFDWSLWPFVPRSEYVLTGRFYELNGTGSCVAGLIGGGFVTDPCDCNESSWVDIFFDSPGNFSKLYLSYCSGYAGGDLAEGVVYLDGLDLGSVFVEPYSCNVSSIDVDISHGSHVLRLQSEVYKICDDEKILWKKTWLSNT